MRTLHWTGKGEAGGLLDPQNWLEQRAPGGDDEMEFVSRLPGTVVKQEWWQWLGCQLAANREPWELHGCTLPVGAAMLCRCDGELVKDDTWQITWRIQLRAFGWDAQLYDRKNFGRLGMLVRN